MGFSRRSGTVGFLVLVAVRLASPRGAAADAPSPAASGETEQVRQLEAEVGRLRARTEGLEKTVEEMKSEKAAAPAAPPSAAAPAAPAAPGQGLVLSKVKEFKLYLGGMIQLQGDFGDVSAFEGRFRGGPGAIQDRFRLRRVRLNAIGDLLDTFDFKIEGDFSQSDGISESRTAFSVTDVFLNWHTFPAFNVKAGQYKAPFGAEELIPEAAMITPERSLVTTALAPDRQIGVQLWGKPFAKVIEKRPDLLTYAVGVFNGNGRNVSINDNRDFMYAGRGELVPWAGKIREKPVRLRLGGNAFFSRDEAGTNLSQGGNLFENADGSLTAFTKLPSLNHVADERWAWGADAALTMGRFELAAEYLEARIRPAARAVTTGTSQTAAFGALRPSGYYVQGAWFFVPEKWQVVVRWESFDPRQRPDDDIRSVVAGINYYFLGNSLKLMVDYVHTWSEFRDDRTSLEDEFDQVILRAQVMF